MAAEAAAGTAPAAGSAPRQRVRDGAGHGKEAAEEQNLAEVLLLELREARNGQEFAATLAEAFHGAGQRGGEGKLAQKLLAGLEKNGGEQQQLAGKLLAELDASQQEELADALLSGLRRDAEEQDYAYIPPEFVVAGDAAAGLGRGQQEEGEAKTSSAVAVALRSVGREGSAVELLLSKLLDITMVEDGDTTSSAYFYEVSGSGDGVGDVVADDLPGASRAQVENEREHGSAAAAVKQEGGNLYPSAARIQFSLAEIGLGEESLGGGKKNGVVDQAEKIKGGDEDDEDDEEESSWPLFGGMLRGLLFPRKSAAVVLQQYSSEKNEEEEEEEEGSGKIPSASRLWEMSRNEEDEEDEDEEQEEVYSAWRSDGFGRAAEERLRRLETSSSEDDDDDDDGTEIDVVSCEAVFVLAVCFCVGEKAEVVFFVL